MSPLPQACLGEVNSIWQIENLYKEANLRNWRRHIGVIIAAFLILQVAASLLISLGDLITLPVHAHSDNSDQHENGRDDKH